MSAFLTAKGNKLTAWRFKSTPNTLILHPQLLISRQQPTFTFVPYEIRMTGSA